MTTIRDVARAAGVAPITVSRVINNKDYASPETRQRVLQAVAELNYVPNALARSFRWKQTGLLALLVTDITNPFWTTVARGVEDAASDAGLNVILCNTDESEEEVDRYLQALLSRQIDGVLIVPASSSLEALKTLQRHNMPAVVLDRRLPGRETPVQVLDVVRCDSVQGASLVIEYLLGLGHRRIALLNGPAGVSTADDRHTGYCQAFAAAGLSPDERLVSYGQFSVESGEAQAARALALTPRPTAILAANNFLALGALKAIHAAGLRIPQDISLAGFDDLPYSMLVDPALTVASQPAYEMGRKATAVLIERMAKKQPTAPQEFVLPTGLIIRQSCAAPAEA